MAVQDEFFSPASLALVADKAVRKTRDWLVYELVHIDLSDLSNSLLTKRSRYHRRGFHLGVALLECRAGLGSALEGGRHQSSPQVD